MEFELKTILFLTNNTLKEVKIQKKKELKSLESKTREKQINYEVSLFIYVLGEL